MEFYGIGLFLRKRFHTQKVIIIIIINELRRIVIKENNGNVACVSMVFLKNYRKEL